MEKDPIRQPDFSLHYSLFIIRKRSEATVPASEAQGGSIGQAAAAPTTSAGAACDVALPRLTSLHRTRRRAGRGGVSAPASHLAPPLRNARLGGQALPARCVSGWQIGLAHWRFAIAGDRIEGQHRPPERLLGCLVGEKVGQGAWRGRALARPCRSRSGTALASDLVALGEGVLTLEGVELRHADGLGDLAGSDSASRQLR